MELAAYRDIVPTSLMEFWKECGFGLILDGYFQFCRPNTYQPVVNQIFEGNKDFDPKLICPIGFSAFGKQLLWHKDLEKIDVDLVNLIMSCNEFFSKTPITNANTAIASALIFVDMESYDEFDAQGGRLFKQTIKRLGRLPSNSIYGFTPAR